MNQRDELAQDIRAVDGSHSLGAAELAERLAERGWSRPQVVETIEGLEALPDGSVVRDEEACICERDADGWLITGSRNGYIHRDILLPVTVLYVPQEAK